MKRILGSGAVAAAALLLAMPASAKTEATKAKDAPHCQWRHSYAAALEEAKDRNCVIFATMHIDH